MHAPAPRSRQTYLITVLTLTLVAIFAATLPAAAFSGDFTTPKRVWSSPGAPNHAMATDGDGNVHIATERGAAGVWYITNAGGPWTKCQVSSGNDRRPSIDVWGDTVHIAFARLDLNHKGIYTVSSDQLVAGPGCGWAETRRFVGPATQPSLGVHGGALSIAFRTGSKQLKFIKGLAASSTWSIKQTIDGDCCTAPPSLYLTHLGSPRVAYGDGTAKANGLKYAARTAAGWKKAKVAGGRVKQVALALDRTPGLFGTPPGNHPAIAYVLKGKGTYFAGKGGSGVSGGWGKRFLGKAYGPLAIQVGSNLTYIVYTANGNLKFVRHSGGIWFSGKLSGSGADTKPQLDEGRLTYGRFKGTTGIYYTRRK